MFRHCHQHCLLKIVLCDFLYQILRSSYSHTILKILLVCSIESVTKYLSPHFRLIISMCSFSLSSDILIFVNGKFQSNVILLTNNESTILFASSLIILCKDNIVVPVLIFVLTFLVQINQVRFIIIFFLVSYVIYFHFT